MAINKKSKIEKGISTIEILIVIAIITIALTSILGLASLSFGVSTLVKQTNQANNLAQEVMEAVRNFRDGTDWSTNGLGTLTAGTSYYPKKSADTPPKWTLIQGEEVIGGFTRKVIFSDTQRDANDNIVASGGTNDPNTKKTTVAVSWKEKERTHQIEIVTYLTNWK